MTSRGRPVVHDTEEIKIIIERFSNSEKLINLFKEFKIDRSTFTHKVKEYDLYTMYARARELHGDGFNDEIETIKQDVKNGTIKSDVARILMDTVKWQAAKFYPKMYGDKSQVDVTSKGKSINKQVDLSKLTEDELREYAELQSKIETD